MPEPGLSEAAEELLAGLWLARENGPEPPCPVDEASRPAAVRELVEAGLVEEREGLPSLTPAGEAEASAVVRRERLAERLLADVLALGDQLASEAACRFEHLLRRGIDDRICTLLGHPRVCPHGSPIPPGACCQVGAEEAGKVVSSLADLTPGQRGVIAYVHSRRREMLHRLLAMGALPGAPVLLRQRFPSYVFDLGQGQIAVDQETARDIYVRLSDERASTRPRRAWFAPRLRRRRGRG